MDTAPSSVNNIKNDTQYVSHTDSEKREVKVKVLVTYIHQLNGVTRLNQLQNDLDLIKSYKKSIIRRWNGDAIIN